MKRIGVFLLAATLLLGSLPLSASANSPGIVPWYEFELANLPQGTSYVDLLIRLPETDPMYTDLVKSNLPDGVPEDAQIVTYCEEDYRSYTFHYRNASSYIFIEQDSRVAFFTDNPNASSVSGVRYDHADEIAQRGDVRLAMLDEYGNILKVSPLLPLKARGFLSYLVGDFHYDAQTEEFHAESYISGFGVMMYVGLAVLGLIFTCWVEGLILSPFGLKKQFGKLIKLTNAASQILMHVCYILFYSLVFWRYTYATVFLEILVYAGEYLFYRWRMKDVSWRRCLAYTLTANTVSLVCGFLILYVWLF